MSTDFLRAVPGSLALAVLWTAAAAGAGPTNDRFVARAPLVGLSGQTTGVNVGATKEPGEPDIVGNSGGSSVWWKWTAPEEGTATFHTNGSNFDTVLAAYAGGSIAALDLVAEDDDSGLDAASCIVFPVVPGTEYQIAVDGYDGETGLIVLNWLLSPPCGGPPAPSGPDPADGSAGVPREGELRWDQGARLIPKVIYGADDRLDIYEVKDPALLAAWESTVALVNRSSLRDNGDGTFTLPAGTYGEDQDLCSSERFRDQPNPAWCSGFLVGPDLVATAGHCVETAGDCSQVAFVFGFKMAGPSTPVLTFPGSQIYFCDGIVGNRHDDEGADWAIIRLDRKVPDHKPLRIRRSGKIADRQRLILIGHPMGLPAKVAGGASVRDNTLEFSFVANLDSYGGNSGSPVFNADTLTVEGTLVRGDEDFIDMGDCFVSNRCPDDGCEGEEAIRSTEFDHLVPANPDSVTYQVFFGPCGNLSLLGETSEKGWYLKGLDPETTYCWRIVARGECGATEGPLWSFTTAREEPPAFRRGDASDDGVTDLSDALAILFFLFQGEDISCPESADVDDSGDLSITDPIDLLEHLFLGGPAPPAPAGTCGSDPTPDGLDCAGQASCR